MLLNDVNLEIFLDACDVDEERFGRMVSKTWRQTGLVARFIQSIRWIPEMKLLQRQASLPR